MWPFKKRVAGTEEPDSPQEPGGRGPSGGWAGVPTIERTVAPPATTIETASFQADLAALRPPAQFLKPLSHGLSASGPSGLIGGLVMPARLTERAAGPVQRSAVKFAPPPGNRWVTGGQDDVELPGAPGEIQFAEPGPARAYPAPEPPVQADSRPVLLRVRSDALPMVRLPSAPVTASPPVEAPVSPAPVEADAPGSPSPQAEAPGVGDLGTLGSEPEVMQAAQPPDATPAPVPGTGAEPSRPSASVDAPVQRTVSRSPGTGTWRSQPLPVPPTRPGRPLGLGPPLGSYDTVEPPDTFSNSDPAKPDQGLPGPAAPAVGPPTRAQALPIQRSGAPEPARFEPSAPTASQPGDGVVGNQPAVGPEQIPHQDAAVAPEVQPSTAPPPDLPLLGHSEPAQIDAPVSRAPVKVPVQRTDATYQARLDGDRSSPPDSPSPAVGDGGVSRSAEPALPDAPGPESPIAPDTPSLPTQTREPAPGFTPAIQRSEAGPTQVSPPVQEADRSERPTLGSTDPATSLSTWSADLIGKPSVGAEGPTPDLSTWEPAQPPEAAAPSEPVRFSEVRTPDLAEPASAPRFDAPLFTGEGLPIPPVAIEPAESFIQTMPETVAAELLEPATVPLLGLAPESAIEPPAAADAASPPATPLQRMQPRPLDSEAAEPHSLGAESAHPSLPEISPLPPETPAGFADAPRVPSRAANRSTANQPVQRLDAARPAPEQSAAPQVPTGPIEPLPLQRALGGEPVLPETSGNRPDLGERIETSDRPLLGATVEAPGGRASSGELSEAPPDNRPLLGRAVEAAETRPMLREAVEPAANLPLLGELAEPEANASQLQPAETAGSPVPEPAAGLQQMPIQRSSLIERARSWAARESRLDSEPASRSSDTQVVSRKAERPSARSTFELRAPEPQIPPSGARTTDLPAFRPPSVQREREVPETSERFIQPTLTGEATPTLQRLPDSSVPGTNTQDLLPTPAPERHPTPDAHVYSEHLQLVGQDPAPATLRSEPKFATAPAVQRRPATAPEPLSGFEAPSAPPAAIPVRASARPEGRATAPEQAGFAEQLQVQPSSTPTAGFQPPTAQVPLVGEHLSTGLGLPSSFPAPEGSNGARPLIQRSGTSAMESAAPHLPATDLLKGRAHTSLAGPPEHDSQRPLTVARTTFAAPYLPETPPTSAAHNAPHRVQRAADGQPSRDSYVAAAESAAAAAVAAGVASRGADGALVFRSPGAAAPPVPAAPTPPPAPLPAPVPVQRVTATAPATEAQHDGPEPQDLDELAMRLYPKLRPYLRKELWLDRERSGLLADLR